MLWDIAAWNKTHYVSSTYILKTLWRLNLKKIVELYNCRSVILKNQHLKLFQKSLKWCSQTRFKWHLISTTAPCIHVHVLFELIAKGLKLHSVTEWAA